MRSEFETGHADIPDQTERRFVSVNVKGQAAAIDLDIRQADCIEFLRSLADSSVDVIATDPAYSGMNEKLKLGHGRIVGRYVDKGRPDAKWFAEFSDTPENYQVFLQECRRVLKPTGHIYIMFDSYSLLSLGPIIREYFSVKNLITWDKVNLGMGHYYRRRHEYILFATNGNNVKLNSRAFPDVWRVKRLYRAKYPTQKPTELFDIMLSASARPGQVVCDPFMGSGSTGVAAVRRWCHFLGCDVSPHAVQMTKERLETLLVTGEDIYQPDSRVPHDEKRFW